MSDPLTALLDWVANESYAFVACSNNSCPGANPRCKMCQKDEAFAAIKKAWLDAGCPGYPPPTQAPAGTLRVRIAVVQRGKVWQAIGCNGGGDKSAVLACIEILDDAQYEGTDFVTFVEADVPLPPKAPTVEGRVVT